MCVCEGMQGNKGRKVPVPNKGKNKKLIKTH